MSNLTVDSLLENQTYIENIASWEGPAYGLRLGFVVLAIWWTVPEAFQSLP